MSTTKLYMWSFEECTTVHDFLTASLLLTIDLQARRISLLVISHQTVGNSHLTDAHRNSAHVISCSADPWTGVEGTNLGTVLISDHKPHGNRGMAFRSCFPFPNVLLDPESDAPLILPGTSALDNELTTCLCLPDGIFPTSFVR